MAIENNDNLINMFHVKGYIDDNFKEKDLLRKEYTHNLFLYLCSALNLEYVLWRPKLGKHPNCVVEIDVAKIENYDELREIGYKLFDFVKRLIKRKDKYLFEYSELEDAYKLGKVGRAESQNLRDKYKSDEKVLLFDFVNSFEDINQQINIIGAVVHYLSIHVQYKPELNINNSLEKKWIKELRILKNSLKLLIEPVEVKESKKLLINGKKINIVGRYHIAKEVLDIYKIIDRKNISQTEKHDLLAHIMGCNQQTARELWNGTQLKRTKLNEDIINPYLEKLK
jgi:hypothetical protein